METRKIEGAYGTLKECAQAFGISEPTMRGLVHMENFPALRIGQRWVIPRAAAEEWFNEAAKRRDVM